MLEISFNEGQLDAIDKIKRFLSPLNQSKICILSGYAGTGKTTIISHITHSPQFSGKRTILTATTNKAVAVLQGVSNKYAQTAPKEIPPSDISGKTKKSDKLHFSLIF